MATNVAARSIGRILPLLVPSGRGAVLDDIQGLPDVETRAHPAGVTSGSSPDSEPEVDMSPSFVLEMDDPWFPEVDLIQAKNIILSFNAAGQQAIGSFQSRRLQWPRRHSVSDATDCEFAPVFNKLNEETAQFIVERDLTVAVVWLQTIAPRFFGGADFEIRILPAEDGEDNLLALKVYGAFSSSEFRRRRRQICETILNAGHEALYSVISVFQRRVQSSGWQALSWYSTLSPE